MNHENPLNSSENISRSAIALLIFLGIVARVFFSEHRGHLLGIFPYLLLLACPFMHFFMHGGHGKHSGGGTPLKHSQQTERRFAMSVNVRALIIAGITVAVVSYIVCAMFVALAPEIATKIGGDIVHMDLSSVGRSVTWTGACIGLVFFTVFVALVCSAAGALYNRLAH